MKRTFKNLVWHRVLWQRPFEVDDVISLLTHLASLTPRGPIIWEVRGCQGVVHYLIGACNQWMRKIQDVFKAHGNVRFSEVDEIDGAMGSADFADLSEAGSAADSIRKPVDIAKCLKITRPTLSLKTDLAEAVTRASLSALLQNRGREQTVLQVILGPSYSPAPVPHNFPDPHAGWLQVVLGNVAPASAECRNAVRDKSSCPSFAAVIRLGATGTKATAPSHVYDLFSALRTLTSAGVRISAAGEKTEKLDSAHVPWTFPLRLSVKELANFLLLPVGDADLPGVAGLHPRQVLPPSWYRNPDKAHTRAFAVSPDGKTQLSISPQDSLEHAIVLGPTGSGKSTVLQNLILADINAGRSVLVIDPKADLVNDILARIPQNRDNDVIVLDPSEKNPCGFNPLAFKDYHNPGLIADAILSVFQEVFRENWGIRSQDVLSAALLTLAQTEGASLLWLPTLLTDAAFRKKITAGVTDRIGLAPYWAGFEAMSDSMRRQEILPVLNKIRQFLLRPNLRNVLGQSNPKFDLRDLFTKSRIVLVPLNKGIIGSESARLLGSLVVGLTWTLALGRAREPGNRRKLTNIYIDELQDYLSLPTDLSDALAQARGLGVSLTLAHQFREQLPPEIRAGVDANARNKIVFGLNATDAKSMAAMAQGELDALDFMTLPRYQVYTSFQQRGRNTGWLSGKTLPPPRPFRDPIELRAKSTALYGKSEAEIEQEYLELLNRSHRTGAGSTEATDEPEECPTPVGRRKKS